MERVLRESSWKLRQAFLGADEERLAATAVTVAVTDIDGVAVTGSPFTATEPTADSGIWQIELPPGATGTLGVYDAVWSADIGSNDEKRRGQFEIVGAFLFDLADLRQTAPELEDPNEATSWLLRSAREAAEDRFDERCRPSFRRRRRRVAVDGSGHNGLLIPDLHPKALIALEVDDVAITGSDLQPPAIALDNAGVLWRPAGWTCGRGNVEVTYEHGLDSVPRTVHDAAVKLARSYIVKSPLPDRATSQVGDAGVFRIAIAGRDGPTGIPDVDAIMDQFAHELVVG